MQFNLIQFDLTIPLQGNIRWPKNTNPKDRSPRFKEEFVQEYFAKHDNPQFPSAWKTLEHVSFGTLSKLYWGNPNRCGNAESELY
ncbi:Abi family protein [uncultured Bacteroides sp.]|uniref:Abi family protein n=1 Tax=uncultured Bacteroides sp. TaxID=162156 RepID=UPI002631F65C|nr:Abi family protein [uncultured Bacteroides sp.]